MQGSIKTSVSSTVVLRFSCKSDRRRKAPTAENLLFSPSLIDWTGSESYRSVGLVILPMKSMLLVLRSTMNIRKGLLRFMVSGRDMGMISTVVVPAASVPFSSTFRIARWRTWGWRSFTHFQEVFMPKTGLCKRIIMPISQHTLEAFSLVSSLIPEKSASLEKASTIPSSFRMSPRQEQAEMENLGKYRSTELKDKDAIRGGSNREKSLEKKDVYLLNILLNQYLMLFLSRFFSTSSIFPLSGRTISMEVLPL